MITLKSGEKLRWFPQWTPMWAEAEKDYAKIFEIYAPLDDNYQPRLYERETPHARMERMGPYNERMGGATFVTLFSTKS